ncbi:GNAT family N-acetyltransferase [Gordonia shandongensis]|uniref:GNAT family N-acetyltransferase n=1 Tax=Gordonia shandongensis TaxID=376351 RepID=UPI00047E5D5A|nr:GNAT family N-acetyltransferase [Gordonia shandongensis]
MPSVRRRLTRLHPGETVLLLTTAMLATAASLSAAFAVKAPCTTPPGYPDGYRQWLFAGPRDAVPCYSDLMTMWHGRGLADHVFPYIHGGIAPDGQLFGGAVEYPVLSGLIMWISGLGADSDFAFLWHSLLVLAPFAFVTSIILAVLSRWWVLLWVATPPLLLYALHNWELPVVCASVVAVAVMARGGSADPATGLRRWSVRTTTALAAVPLGVGFSLKIYPGLFVIPLALYALTRGEPGADRRRGLDPRGALIVVAAAAATVAATQLPFMIAGFDGWRAAISFQTRRMADMTTNSVWYWGLRPLMGGETPEYDRIVGVASPVLIAAAFLAACALGMRVYRRTGAFPWLGVSAAALAGFMLFHKVHSPQYTLWILPFFVLLRVRWWWIVTYLVGDLIVALTVFHLLADHDAATLEAVESGVAAGVWIQAVVLLALLFVLPRTPAREPLASYLAGAQGPPGPLTRLRAADAAAARVWLGTPTLAGRAVTLRPLALADAEALGAVASDPDLYRWTSGVPRGRAAAAAWIRDALADPERIPFAVVDAAGHVVGTTSFYDVDESTRSLAIGYTFYAPDAMGTAVNPEAKLLACEYAFTDCGAVRIVWHTHAQNARSRRAIEGIGARAEGELAKHRRFGDGWRTTAQFALTDDEWPAARAALRARVAAAVESDAGRVGR